jgi:WD40 repeat protein
MRYVKVTHNRASRCLDRWTLASTLLVVLCAILVICEQRAQGVAVAASRSSSATAVRPALPVDDQPELILQYSHSDRVYDVSFASRAPVFATNGFPADPMNGSIDIWDTRNWTLQRTIDISGYETDRNYNTKAIALSPNGRTLAYATARKGVLLWDVATGKLAKTLSGSVGLPVGVAWSPDGRMLAVGGTDAVQMWDTGSGKLLRTFPAKGDVAFSRNGRILGIAGEDSAAIFDVASGRKIRAFSDKAGVSGPIAISPSGKYVATGGEDPNWHFAPVAGLESEASHRLKVKLWDLRSGKLVRMFSGHYSEDGGTQVLQFTPDSRKLFAGGEGFVALWDIRTGKLARQFDNEYGSALSPDGKMIAVSRFANWNGFAIYSAATGKILAKRTGPPSRVQSLAFSPDGRLLAQGSEAAEPITGLRLWNVERGRMSLSLTGPPPNLQNVGFIDARQVFSNSFNGIYLWSLSTNKLERKIQGPMEDTGTGPEQRWALMTPDGSKIVNQAGGSFPSKYVVRERTNGKLISTIENAGGWMEGEPLSPDGRFLVTRVHSMRSPPTDAVYVWDLNTGRKVSELAEPGHSVMLTVFSPDGKMIAGSVLTIEQTADGSTTESSKLVLWDVQTGAVLREKSLGKGRTIEPAFSVDGRKLALATDSTIHLYNVDSLDEIGILKGGPHRHHCSGILTEKRLPGRRR